jgi:hypothetical protein
MVALQGQRQGRASDQTVEVDCAIHLEPWRRGRDTQQRQVTRCGQHEHTTIVHRRCQNAVARGEADQRHQAARNHRQRVDQVAVASEDDLAAATEQVAVQPPPQRRREGARRQRPEYELVLTARGLLANQPRTSERDVLQATTRAAKQHAAAVAHVVAAGSVIVDPQQGRVTGGEARHRHQPLEAIAGRAACCKRLSRG